MKPVIRQASAADVSLINSLAAQTWWHTYQSFISKEQLDFMFNKMYSEEGLIEQLETGHVFLLAEFDGQVIGFVSYVIADERRVKIPKLYIHPSAQGMGVGAALVEAVAGKALEQSRDILQLNVNRENKAQHFYAKLGFEIVATVDIPYDKFILNDYVLEKYLD
jgi:diamine N-acetyltransferase